MSTEAYEQRQREEHALKLKAGLAYAGENEDGEKEYIGTRAQWERLEELEDYQNHLT